jgi:hypothetical protein
MPLVISAVPGVATAETVDSFIKRKVAAGEFNVVIKEHTRDACDKSCNVTFTSTTDGNVVVRPGETKYFRRNKDIDDYTRSGGYYWKCCNTDERSRIRDSTFIMVVRKEDTGAFDQFWVELAPIIP